MVKKNKTRWLVGVSLVGALSLYSWYTHYKQSDKVHVPSNFKPCFQKKPTVWNGEPVSSEVHGAGSSVVDMVGDQEIRSRSSGSYIETPTSIFWLTAAHAVLDLSVTDSLQIQLGGMTKDISIKDSYCHRDYDPKSLDNDIAIVPIAGSLPFEELKRLVKPAGIGDNVIVYGSGLSGQSGEGFSIGELHKGEFKVVRIENNTLELQPSDDTENKRTMVCQGDSGSAVMDLYGNYVGVVKSIYPEPDNPFCGESAFVQVIDIGE